LALATSFLKVFSLSTLRTSWLVLKLLNNQPINLMKWFYESFVLIKRLKNSNQNYTNYKPINPASLPNCKSSNWPIFL
jgi:hypothetical protein